MKYIRILGAFLFAFYCEAYIQAQEVDSFAIWGLQLSDPKIDSAEKRQIVIKRMEYSRKKNTPPPKLKLLNKDNIQARLYAADSIKSAAFRDLAEIVTNERADNRDRIDALDLIGTLRTFEADSFLVDGLERLSEIGPRPESFDPFEETIYQTPSFKVLLGQRIL